MRGKVTIGRSSNDVIRISIEDDDAGITFVTAEMSPADFGMMITGLSGVDAEVTVRGLDLVGTRREHKEEFVPCKGSPTDKTALLAPFEVDGWGARKSDLGNYHRYSRDPEGYRVMFTRNVPKEST